MKASIPDRKWLAGPHVKYLLPAFLLGNLLAAPIAHAALRYEILKSFGSDTNDSRQPHGGLIEGNDAAFYGTTRSGGSNNGGTVFKMNKDGTHYAILHHFGGSSQGDGARPEAGLVEGSDGVLYGTTRAGGTNDTGTVFKLNKDGSAYSVLHDFDLCCADGYWPSTALLEGSDGKLYGTAQYYIFTLNKDGSNYRVIWAYFYPSSRLMEGSDGLLYGTGQNPSGAPDCGFATGAVFWLTKDGSTRNSFLHEFTLCGEEGSRVRAGLVEGSDGLLYGVTDLGFGFNGTNSGGAVFKLNREGSSLTVLHSFSSLGPDGSHSRAELIEGRDKVLYGTTYAGGTNGRGTVFRLNRDGSGFGVLHHFSRGSFGGDGRFPRAPLVEGSDGALYGTTEGGGQFGGGTVFKLWPPPRLLPPVVSNGAVTLRIVDGPSLTNEIQRATALDGSWLTLTNIAIPANGMGEFTDGAPPQPSAFYRVVAP